MLILVISKDRLLMTTVALSNNNKLMLYYYVTSPFGTNLILKECYAVSASRLQVIWMY